MPAESEHEDHGSENDMVELRNPSEYSANQHHANNTDQSRVGYNSWRKRAAYRKLYGIITLMTMILFALNIAQVCLLRVISSLYWIVLCPGIIFVTFTLWACIFVYYNWEIFHSRPWDVKAGRSHALQHLRTPFSLPKSSEHSQHVDTESNWPIRFTRAGVTLTISLNIILCQFIYLPIFAVPAFREIVWKIDLSASDSVKTPSFALLQDTSYRRRATLENNTLSIEQLCTDKSNVDPNQLCFRYRGNITYGDSAGRHLAYYSVFDGSEHPLVAVGEILDLWYQYSYYRRVSPDPLLSLAVFDKDLLSTFELAYQCGIIASTSFPAGKRVQASLQQIDMNDPYNALDRSGRCRRPEFVHYRLFDVNVVPLGASSAPGNNICNLNDKRWNGSCDGDVTVAFTSSLTRNYTSGHGKNWVTILTEEGGIVGFVTFLTWFFGIFNF